MEIISLITSIITAVIVVLLSIVLNKVYELSKEIYHIKGLVEMILKFLNERCNRDRDRK